MVKLGLTDLINDLTGGIISKKYNSHKTQRLIKIEDVTINGITYYRCVEKDT
jgi:orotate phosphoribosyltransferase-like protein